MTPLRTRMIRELELRRKAPGTVNSYVKAVAELARYHGRSPDQIPEEEVRDYVHYLIAKKKLSYSSCNQKVVAISFFNSLYVFSQSILFSLEILLTPLIHDM